MAGALENGGLGKGLGREIIIWLIWITEDADES